MPENTIGLTDYVEQMAALINLPLAPEHRPVVVENISRIAAIAQLIIDRTYVF